MFLNNNDYNGSKKYIHLRVSSRSQIPEDLKNIKIDDLPQAYQSPIYICPNSMQFDIYESKVDLGEEPIDQTDIIKHCINVERILLNMYPGGAGMEVSKSKTD